MGEMDWHELDRLVRARKLGHAVAYLEAGLREAPSPRFRSLIGARFSNEPRELALHLAAFCADCEKSFRVRAIYLEMNGFDINPHRWYFDYFAYEAYVEDESELEWLCEFNITTWPATTLFGLESVQQDFDWYSNQRGYEDPNAKVAASFAVPLVMCRFAELIQSAVRVNPTPFEIPILATAHDFDVVPRFLPADSLRDSAASSVAHDGPARS